MKYCLFLIPGLFLSQPVLAACGSHNVYDDIACYDKQLPKDKQKLNRLYDKLYKSYDTEGKAALEASQKTWLNYKVKQCEYVQYQARYVLGGGMALVMRVCESNLVNARFKELKEADTD